MPLCHDCKHNGKRRRVCLKCKGPSEYVSHHHTVSLDAILDAGVDPSGKCDDIQGEVDRAMLGLAPVVECDPYTPAAYDFASQLFDHVRAGRHRQVDRMLRRLVKAAPRQPVGTPDGTPTPAGTGTPLSSQF